MAIITPALGAARTSLNRRFPNRDRATDGWIGDAAHRGTRSGHNPDETGNPEYQDDDNLDEVRAVDLDRDLRHPTLTMHDVVRAILATPRDRDRCSYLIYDRTIWSRSAGYKPRAYTGSNPHTGHLHISGRPTNDADGRPWLSIERLGIEEDDMTPEELVKYRQKWSNDWPVKRFGANPDGYTLGTYWSQTYAMVRADWEDGRAERAALLGAVNALAGGQDVRAKVDAALAKHREVFLPELVGTLGPDLVAALLERVADLDVEVITEVVEDALSRVQLAVRPAEGED